MPLGVGSVPPALFSMPLDGTCNRAFPYNRDCVEDPYNVGHADTGTGHTRRDKPDSIECYPAAGAAPWRPLGLQAACHDQLVGKSDDGASLL
jgi:hypothetical protein